MDKLGKYLLNWINVIFDAKIPVTDETTKSMAKIFNETAQAEDLGYCPDCDERRPCEPICNEGHD